MFITPHRTKIDDKKVEVELLRKYEAEFKKALVHESGTQKGLFDEKKKPKDKNLVTRSL
jgi:hypothetical protein